MASILGAFVGGGGAAVAGLELQSHAGGVLVRTVAGDSLAEVPNRLGLDSAEDPNDYICLACLSGRVGERQFAPIKLRGADESTLGYVFPLAALCTGEAIEGQWPRRYAWVGARYLLNSDQASSWLRVAAIDLLRAEEIYLDDLFSDTVSVAVFGRENLRRHGVDERHLNVMLRGAGFRFPERYGDDFVLDVTGAAAAIYVNRVSPEIEADLDPIDMLLQAGTEDGSAVSQFLTLYQVIEYAIGRVFEWAVAGIAIGAPDPWALKYRVAKVPSERWRLNVLASACLSGSVSGSSVDLARSCGDFLAAIGEKHEPSWPWWLKLYKVRNVVVHGQLRIISRNYINLREIVQDLRAVCVDVVFKLSQPDMEVVWSSVRPDEEESVLQLIGAAEAPGGAD